MTFPEYFPDACPPLSATEKETAIFRFMIGDRNNPTSHENFKSHVEREAQKEDDDLCAACGLSIYTDLRGIEAAIIKVKSFQRNKPKIAKVIIKAEDGVFLDTPNKGNKYHITLWLRRDATPWMAAEVYKP